ncbi:MAG: hypothetical protein NZZ41_07485, partial [Candidatus Dojkabacteria bacterium]|nr:hypothetical protein [Candidatus Dojkabacteria bacterium]
DGVLSDLEKISSEDFAISEKELFKETGAIKYLLDIFESAEEAGSFACDLRVLSSFDFMPTFIIYQSNSDKQDEFQIDSLSCGFLSNTFGAVNLFEGEKIQDTKTNQVKTIFYDVSFYHKIGYFNQYSAIKNAICIDSLSKFYDELSDFIYENYLKQHEKYSTIHNLFVANIFSLLFFLDSSGFGEALIIKAPVCKVNANLKYIDNFMSIEDFSISIDRNNRIEGSSSDVLLDFDFPIVSIFADSSSFDFLVDNAFCVVSKRNSSASVDEIHDENMFSDDIEVR